MPAALLILSVFVGIGDAYVVRKILNKWEKKLQGVVHNISAVSYKTFYKRLKKRERG